MKTQNFDQKDLDEIVFENRHKEYGAYVLRKEYETNVLSSFFIAIGSFMLVVFTPLFIQYLMMKNDVNLADLVKTDDDVKVVEVFNAEKPKVEELKAEQPKPNSGGPKNDASAAFNIQKGDSAAADPKKYDPNADPKGDNPDKKGGDGEGKGKEEGGGKKTDSADVNTNVVQEFAEVDPQFIGGEEALFKFLSRNIKYPERVKEMGKQGTVWIAFIVDRMGKVKDVEVIRGMKNECDEEAARVIRMMPDWKPGTNGGKPVNVRYKIPIKFELRG